MMKKRLCAFLLAFMLIASVLPGGAAPSVNADVLLTTDLFRTEGGALLQAGVRGDSGEAGMKMAGRTGGGAYFVHRAAGSFSMRFELSSGVSDFAVGFTPAASAGFELHIQKTDRVQAYVLIDGKKCGAYYSPHGRMGYAKVQNENGVFTDVGATAVFDAAYNFESGDVSVNGITVWNVRESVYDGRDAGRTASADGPYKVSFRFDSASAGSSALLINAGGQNLSAAVLTDNAAPMIAGRPAYNALAGVPYTFTAPEAYDLVDGVVSDIRISVADMNNFEVIPEQTYTAGFQHTFAAGDYAVKFRARDAAGNWGVKTYPLSVVPSQSTGYECSFPLSGMTVGAGQAVLLPSAKIISNLCEPKYADIVIAGPANETLKADAEKPYAFLEAGVYTVKFCAADNPSLTAESVTVTVSAGLAAFDLPILQKIYPLDSLFTAPVIAARLGGTVYETGLTVYFPSGGAFSNRQFRLTELGEYRLKYTAVAGGSAQNWFASFYVHAAAADLFETEHMKLKAGASDLSDALRGLQVESNPIGKLAYKSVIDLELLGPDTPFIDVIAAPKTLGKMDFSQIVITLTDIHDEKNTLTIRIFAVGRHSHPMELSYVQAQAPGQPFTGLYYNEFGESHPNATNWGGTTVWHSFEGSEFPYARQEPALSSVRLYYDTEQNALYVSDEMHVRGRRLCAQFDDPEQFRILWGGFTTNQVRLSVSTGGVATGGTGLFVIRSLAGMSFTDTYAIDSEPPLLFVDAPAQIPAAKVGTPYKLFPAHAKDLFDPQTSIVTSVRLSGSGAELPVANGAFVPIIEGKYIIVYRAFDRSGNSVEKTVEVAAKHSVGVPAIILGGESAGPEVKVGLPLRIQSFMLTGEAAGGGTVSVTVRNTTAGKDYSVSDGMFLPAEAGTYQIKYAGTDYIGQTAEASYTLAVADSPEPVLSASPSLPDAFISGFTYKLPPLTAVDYSGASPQPVAGVPSVTVNGAPQSIDANGNFKPVISGSDGTALITYNFTGGTGTHTENYTVPVVDVKTNVFMTDVSRYFVSDGFTKTAKSSFVSFAGSVSGATAGFIRPLSAENFSFTLYLAESGLNNMNYVDFTLTDKDSAGCAILLRLYPNDRISIGGGSTNAIYSDSVGGYKRMTINYSPSYNRFTDARGSLIGVPARTTAGAAFNGFSSGEVYLRFATGALTGGIEVGISAINGQPLTAGTLLDRTPPMVLLNPDLGGAKNIGDIVTVHAARACDVLSEVAWVRVSVIDNVTGAFIKGTDGVEIRNLDASRDYEFKIERPGVYRIRFTAADGAGNESLPIFKLIQAFDTIPPVITVNGTVPRTARLNSTVTVPGMTVTDNISSVDDPLSPLKSMVILFEPSGQQRIITNSFAATMSGVYIVRYFAWDADGNTTIRDFEITVS